MILRGFSFLLPYILRMSQLAQTPDPPYYAVIFSSVLMENTEGYKSMADLMVELSSQYEGFLGIDSARENVGITVCYWDSLEAIESWKQNASHKIAQVSGKEAWYKEFVLRIAKVEKQYGFER